MKFSILCIAKYLKVFNLTPSCDFTVQRSILMYDCYINEDFQGFL